MRALLALIVVLSACSGTEESSQATSACFREAPDVFAAKAEAELRAALVRPERPACQGSVDDGLAICDVHVDAFVDADGHAVKVATATTRGANRPGGYSTESLTCELTCHGSACSMSGCLPVASSYCSPFDCGAGCTGTCRMIRTVP